MEKIRSNERYKYCDSSSDLTRICYKMYLCTGFYYFSFLIMFFSSVLISFTSSEKDITINVGPKSEECFYETLKSGQALDIDYQVIDGGQGALDISFYLTAPGGRVIVMDYKKIEKAHRINIDEDGDYKLCFDNRFSSFNTKTVYFELIIETEDGNDIDFDEGIKSKSLDDEQYEITIHFIEESIKRVKSHLMKIRHLQETARAFATRDKNVLEGNSFKVYFWSILQIAIMLTVGFVQVIMVKSLFDDQSKMHKIWKKTLS